jgi:hypothetical protein
MMTVGASTREMRMRMVPGDDEDDDIKGEGVIM